jgi:hypothetical protein
MAVTKEAYTLNANWTADQAADLLKDAFIDAGYMADWHDSFTISTGRLARVLKIEYDSTKTYGTSFYIFYFQSGNIRVTLASGWDTSTDLPTGTQFLDFISLPSSYNTADSSFSNPSTTPVFSGSATSDLILTRYTSNDDAKQSWLVFSQGTDISQPFSVLHKDTVLHPWLDLDKGMISGYVRVALFASNTASGTLAFRTDQAVRRCLLLGTALRGEADVPDFRLLSYNNYCYTGAGSVSNNTNNNLSPGRSTSGSAVLLPVGKNSANPAFLTDYIPICTDLPWSIWTPTRLADDFAVYMHYASNTIAYQNKFIVQAGINEWETLAFANNTVINDGASATFLARVV